MPENTPKMGVGDGDEDHHGEDRGRKNGPRGPSGKEEWKDHSPDRMDKDKYQAKEYGCHLLEADLEMDDDYAVANKNEKCFDDLDEVDACVHRLEARVVELEDQLKDACNYDDRHNGKCAHYGGIWGYGLGAGSPALSTPMSGPSILMSQAPVTYMGTLSAPPRVNI